MHFQEYHLGRAPGCMKARENVSKEREKGRRREKSVLIAPNEHGATGRTLTHCPQSIIQVLLHPWPKKGKRRTSSVGRTEAERRTWEKEKATHAQRKKRGGGIEGEPPPKEERERGKAHSTHLMRAERFLPPSSSSPLIPPTPLLGERERGNKSQLFPVVGSPSPPTQCMCVHTRPFLLLVSPQTTTKSLLKGEIQQRNTTFHQKSPAPLTYGGNLLFLSNTVSCFRYGDSPTLSGIPDTLCQVGKKGEKEKNNVYKKLSPPLSEFREPTTAFAPPLSFPPLFSRESTPSPLVLGKRPKCAKQRKPTTQMGEREGGRTEGGCFSEKQVPQRAKEGATNERERGWVGRWWGSKGVEEMKRPRAHLIGDRLICLFDLTKSRFLGRIFFFL